MSDSAPDVGSSAHATPPRLPHPASSVMELCGALVADDLAAVDRRLVELLQSSIPIIPDIGGHLALAGGKRLRPLCTLLAAQAAGFRDPCRITVATVGELLHTATLLHDDVIDEGEFRRGRPAARLCYGNGMAVLAGDFCLARGLQAIASTGHLEAVRTLSDAVTRMAEGEVAQLMIAGDASLDRRRYEMVIDRKTAALIAWCTSVGGLVDAAHVEPLRRYGLELGYAFQISDDVIDYIGDVNQSGKARGQDLREGKMTLPLLLACEEDVGLHTVVRRALSAGPPIDEAMAMHVVESVVASAALDGCREIAHGHAARAVEALEPLPGSAAKDALEALALYVVRRSA